MTRPVRLKYGSSELVLDAPSSPKCRVLSEPLPPGSPITAGRVAEALDNPTGSPPFQSLFKSCDKVTIVVPDITRYSGAEVFLPPMLDRLNTAGVADDATTILFANGTHRKHTDEERRKIVGEEAFARVRCVDHDPREDLAPSAAIVDGAPVRLNRLVVECSRLVITGAIGLHYLAGFGGGRKALMPGVASLEAANEFHFLSMNRAGPGRHPKARSGSLEGNPMHERAMEVMRALEPAFLLNTIINSRGEAVEIAAGEAEAAFERGCDLARARAMAPIDSLADVVVASCGGYPKDINFIQAHKAYDNAVNAVKPGGRVFLAAQCRDGIGSETFLPWLKHKTAAQLERALRENFQINGQTALATLEKSETRDTVLLSSLPDDQVRSMGMRPAPSAGEFLRQAALALEEAGAGLIIPESGYILPRLVR